MKVAEGKADPKGRVFYRTSTGMFGLTKPIDGEAATHANGGYTSGRHNCDTVLRRKDARVRARVAELQEAIPQQAEAEAESHESDWVVALLVKIARADPRKFFHADGAPKKVHQLGDEEAAALSGFEVTGEAGKVVDRLKVLELLGRHFGLWQQKPALAHDVNLFEGMSLDDFRRVCDRVGQLLRGAGMDLPGSTARRCRG